MNHEASLQYAIDKLESAKRAFELAEKTEDINSMCEIAQVAEYWAKEVEARKL